MNSLTLNFYVRSKVSQASVHHLTNCRSQSHAIRKKALSDSPQAFEKPARREGARVLEVFIAGLYGLSLDDGTSYRHLHLRQRPPKRNWTKYPAIACAWPRPFRAHVICLRDRDRLGRTRWRLADENLWLQYFLNRSKPKRDKDAILEV